jgi:ribosomal protein L7/L12
MSETTVIANLRERVAKLERAVAFFERHLGVSFVDEDGGGVSPEVVGLVRAGDKIGAIKRHMELTGVGLKAAKDVIDGIE